MTGTLGACLLLGGIVSAFGGASRQPITRSPKPVFSQATDLSCRGGEGLRLGVELLPDAVNSKGAKEMLEYHAVLSSTLGEDASVAWTALVADDDGNVVATLQTGESKVGPRSEVSTPPLVLDLKDGHYALRVRALIHTETFEQPAEGVQYLVVGGEKMREVSYDEWRNASAASLAVLGPEEDAK
jgi:hypothetical protein